MRALSAKVCQSGYLSAIFCIEVILSICTFAGVSNISAQKTKPPQRKQSVAKAILADPSGICIPPNTDYVSILQIDNNAKATLITQTNKGSKFLFDASLLSSANDVLTAVFNKPTVTVKADPSLKVDLVVKILKGARQALDSCFNVEASTRSEDPYVYIYPEPRELSNLPVYPNPLTLIVQLDKNADLTLNNEKQGSLNDTSILRNTLTEIFRSREENGVFRKGTNAIEKTVSVKAVSSAKFGDVVKIVDALKEAGASPVGLQIDDVDNAVDTRLEILKP